MLESYKLLKYLIVFVGLVFLTLAMIFAYYASILAFPFSVCGAILLFGEITILWTKYLGSNKSQQMEREEITKNIPQKETGSNEEQLMQHLYA
jgi:hypothetical protein